MAFPEMLRELREKKGYTQQDLGKLLSLSKNAISHYEKGISQPSLETLIKIADIFDVSVDYLIGRTVLKLKFSLLKSSFTKGMGFDEYLDTLLSVDVQHRQDILKLTDYVFFHNEVNVNKKKAQKK